MARRNRKGVYPPKGSYRIPTGGYASVSAASQPHPGGRALCIRAIRRERPEVELLAQVFVDMAIEIERKNPRSYSPALDGSGDKGSSLRDGCN